MLNARIRKVLLKKIPIYSIGNPGDLTYEYTINWKQKLMILRKYLIKKMRFFKKISSSKKPINNNW